MLRCLSSSVGAFGMCSVGGAIAGVVCVCEDVVAFGDVEDFWAVCVEVGFGVGFVDFGACVAVV